MELFGEIFTPREVQEFPGEEGIQDPGMAGVRSVGVGMLFPQLH